ncbi:MAG TPA: prepilin-type N-terminal cleavage/methylation domain-containing protein [Candidatus Absconditabacterales bacterium]|nr:prepilin-type N-terminal cleavage/methylation domain-containing protein [Candidatus Absconditabacterales bacterium]HRU50259.1 prepilin-type N-terminal cleavage/methylation domain-containing protein [Candidatus Absconditabacterales bacterium]
MKFKKGFTLIEMLIVIVIIGILTAAIIPRLNSARGRANDVARKADLNQVATALITFQLDRGHFPRGNSGGTGVTIDKISSELIEGGMTSIPKDPANSSRFSGSNELTNPNTPFNGYYIYQTIKKSGIPNGGFILMAQMESHGQSNYVICGDSQIISKEDDYGDIHLCSTIEKVEEGCTPASSSSTVCQYSSLDQLRHVYKY